MKKILLFFTTLLITITQLQAQEESTMHFGLKAAPSMMWIKTDTKGVTSDGTKFGFGYGLITEFKFSEHYAFATGVDVTYRGGTLKFDTQSGDTTRIGETTSSLQYIEIPITLKLKTNDIGDFVYFLQFGLAPGFNIRAKADYKTTTQVGSHPATANEELNVDIKDNINNLNLSMIISGGLEYRLSGETVLLTAITFNNGFLDVFDGDEIKGNSNFLALTIGVLF